MKKLIFFFVLIPVFSSCGLLKRVTTERTVIITQIDTVLHINMEGFKPLTTEKPIHDTVYLETQTGTSIAYIDPIKAKIMLQFIPKTFDVPIVINKKEKYYQKKSNPDSGLIIKIILITWCFGLLLIGFVFWYINRKLKKILP